MMKRILALLIGIILVFSLSACATVKKDVELSQERANIQSIEIFFSDNTYTEGDIHQFREENKPFTILAMEDHSAFLDALCALHFEKEVIFFPIPMDGGYYYEGYIVAIVYADGGYDIISEHGLYSYAVGKNGRGQHDYDYSDYCGEIPWVEFVETYAGTYIEK